jgi:hypothetical protein
MGRSAPPVQWITEIPGEEDVTRTTGYQVVPTLRMRGHTPPLPMLLKARGELTKG